MIARGCVMERVTKILGPLRRRETYEVWTDDYGQTWTAPRTSHFTLGIGPNADALGERYITRLPAMGLSEVKLLPSVRLGP